MPTLQRRLQAVLKDGNLTIADLARWLDKPDPTVRGWINRGLKPCCPARDLEEILDALERLEWKIRKKDGFPVPRMSWGKRKSYIADHSGPHQGCCEVETEMIHSIALRPKQPRRGPV